MRRELPFHILAILTMVFWGGSAACTKVMLYGFTAIHILFLKYFFAYLTLILLCPKPLKCSSKRDELLFFCCGLCGATLTFLFENVALGFTSSATVSVMFNTTPILVMLFYMIVEHRKSGILFWVGCAVCMLGAWLVAFNGLYFIQTNLLGVFLCLLAAVMWGIYVILSEKLGGKYELKAGMRRIFFYGVLTQIPLLAWEHQGVDLSYVLSWQTVLQVLYMGVLAGAASYLFWNLCLVQLGSIKTNIYQYLLPFFTMAISMLTIHEPMGSYQWVGVALTILGVALSQRDKHLAKPR